MNIERSYRTAMEIQRDARANSQRIVRMAPIKGSDGSDGFIVMSVPEMREQIDREVGRLRRPIREIPPLVKFAGAR